jgi:hypothetical protein
MDNPETLATQGTGQKNTTRKTKKMSKTDLTKNRG